MRPPHLLHRPCLPAYWIGIRRVSPHVSQGTRKVSISLIISPLIFDIGSMSEKVQSCDALPVMSRWEGLLAFTRHSSWRYHPGSTTSLYWGMSYIKHYLRLHSLWFISILSNSKNLLSYLYEVDDSPATWDSTCSKYLDCALHSFPKAALSTGWISCERGRSGSASTH